MTSQIVFQLTELTFPFLGISRVSLTQRSLSKLSETMRPRNVSKIHLKKTFRRKLMVSSLIMTGTKYVVHVSFSVCGN